MHRPSAVLSRVAGAALLLAMGGLAACDAPAPRSPLSSTPREESPRAPDDPRIGAGLPAELRMVGTEHNRLTLAVLRRDRGQLAGFRDDGARCRSILDGLSAEMAATVTAAAIPEREAQVLALLRGAMARHPRCAGRVTPPSVAEAIGDGTMTADGDPSAVLTDAAFSVIDQMLRRIATSASEGEVQSALGAATAAASGLGATDATAVQAAVSQTQGSLVLWAPEGAGWSELQAPYEAQSVLRMARQQIAFVPAVVGALSADAAGCRAALEFMRSLPIIQDSRLLMSACAAGAAAGTLLYGYTYYHME